MFKYLGLHLFYHYLNAKICKYVANFMFPACNGVFGQVKLHKFDKIFIFVVMY